MCHDFGLFSFRSCYRGMNHTKQNYRECFQLVLSSERLKCWQQAKEAETGGMCSPLPVRRLNCCVPTGTADFFFLVCSLPFFYLLSLFLFTNLSFAATLLNVSRIYIFRSWKSGVVVDKERPGGELGLQIDIRQTPVALQAEFTAELSQLIKHHGSLSQGRWWGPCRGLGWSHMPKHWDRLSWKDGPGIWHARGNSVRLSLWSPCRQFTVFIFAFEHTPVHSVWCTCF